MLSQSKPLRQRFPGFKRWVVFLRIDKPKGYKADYLIKNFESDTRKEATLKCENWIGVKRHD